MRHERTCADVDALVRDVVSDARARARTRPTSPRTSRAGARVPRQPSSVDSSRGGLTGSGARPRLPRQRRARRPKTLHPTL